MSDLEDDSILDNLQKTRELWSSRADVGSPDIPVPKSKSPISPMISPPPVTENHVNGHQQNVDVIRFEDKNEDDFDMPDVKSIKSQWEKAGPAPAPKKTAPTVERSWSTNRNHTPTDLVPVNREPEESKEEYEVQLGQLRDKFEKKAKEAKARIPLDGGPSSSTSKAAVDERVNIFEGEIEAQRHYHSTKEGSVEMPTVELSSIKKQFEQRKDENLVIPTRTTSKRKSRPLSMSYDSSTAQASEVVRYADPPTEEIKFDIELSSIRKKFESASTPPRNTQVRSHVTVEKKVSNSPVEQTRRASDSENVEVVRSSDAKFDEMIGEESVKDRLASLNSRYKAMTQEAKKENTDKTTFKRRSTTNLIIKEKVVEEIVAEEERDEIVRSPPAGTKEKLDYTASVDLEQTRQLFEQSSDSPSRGSRNSRSSSASSRRSPRSRSTPSPIQRGSRTSSSSSKSPSPIRDGARSSTSNSSQSSGRRSPQSASKSIKKFGDPDVVVLEHTEVNYYYDEDGKRLSSKLTRPGDSDYQDNMSNAQVIKPNPAGTKEEADYVPSMNMHSVRDMFENAKEEDLARGRSLPRKKIIIEKDPPRSDSAISNSPERNPDIVRSATAGVREEVIFEASVDIKTARSKFESPQRPEQYIPRNTIKQREEEARQRRAAVAAASPRSSESSDASFEVVKTAEAGLTEKPDYHVDLKAAKQLFEGGKAPTPIKRENSTSKSKQQNEIKGEVIRPEPAGTKEVIEIKASKDLKSVKQRFENHESEETEEQTRKDPIDIMEESRMVVQKEQEVKEEVQKPNDESEKAESSSSSSSDSELTDTEGEVILEQDDSDHEARVVVSDTIVEEDRESVSSEELVTEHGDEEEHKLLEDVVKEKVEDEKQEEYVEEHVQEDEKQEEYVEEHEQEDEKQEEYVEEHEQEEENEETPAAVVPVRVAITEDLVYKTAEEEPNQDYETYTKVIDYNEEVKQQQSSSESDSESDKDEKSVKEGKEVEQNGVEDHQQEMIEALAADDGLKESVVMNGDVVDNHVNDSMSSDEYQKGLSSNSSNLDEFQQQLSLSSSGQSTEAQAEEEVYLQ